MDGPTAGLLPSQIVEILELVQCTCAEGLQVRNGKGLGFKGMTGEKDVGVARALKTEGATGRKFEKTSC